MEGWRGGWSNGIFMNKVLVTLGKDKTPTYAEALRMADVEPVCVNPSATRKEWRAAFAKCSGLLLSGGGDVACERYGAKLSEKERDEMEITLAREAVKRDLPVLAICRGVQVLNVALGGTLVHDVPTQFGEKVDHSPKDKELRMSGLVHEVTWRRDSRLVKTLKKDFPRVNSSHHQALDKVAEELSVIAHAPDGVIEAVENPDARFLVGVQFHPERLVKKHPEFLGLFRLFAKAV
jgi:putative glutamine amidotransferase